MTAVLPAGQPSQTTAYLYGTGSTSGIFSNDLLAKVEYPDATTGNASTGATDDVSYTYDALGEKTTMTDQNGTTHQYSHDVLGRQTLDAVTTLGSGVDGSIRAIGTNFNTQGRPFQQTSYSDSAGTTVVNQVQDFYNGLGQLTGEYQAHSGSVNTSTTPEVQYAYSDPSLGSRQTSMTYPNGRVLNDVYNTGLDTTIGRVSALADAVGSAAGTDQSYVYQGLGTIIGTTDGNGVTETTTLDNFGRTAEMKYVNASSVTTDDFQYAYDRDGNVLYKNNLLNSAESELYHSNSTTAGDNNTAYDPLNRLTGFARGTLSASGNSGTGLDTVASATDSQSWNLNAVGDQSSVTTNGTTTANSTNAKNELTANGSATLTYDHNGNTTTDENGQTTTYDAWNHAITVKNSGGTAIASYSYDPQGWRITEASAGTTTDVYFTKQWQAIEERQAGIVSRQNVWDEGYVNQLIERDDNSSSGSLGISGFGLGQRLYGQQDATWNVTSLLGNTGDVAQRAIFSPYGTATFLTAAWTSTSDAYAQDVLSQGGSFDSATADYNFHHRDYDPNTDSWKEEDPLGSINGQDLYQLDASDPIGNLDPEGLWKIRREGGVRAYATAERGDTINSLATSIGLTDSAFRLWLQPVGKTRYDSTGTEYNIDTERGIKVVSSLNAMDVICPGEEMSIPNTAYVDRSAYGFFVLGYWSMYQAHVTQSKWEAEGLHVVSSNTWHTTKASILRDLRDPNLYKFFYIGHGEDGRLSASDENINPGQLTQYGIAEMILIGCKTGDDIATWGLLPGALIVEHFYCAA